MLTTIVTGTVCNAKFYTGINGNKPYKLLTFDIPSNRVIGRDKEGKAVTSTTWVKCRLNGERAEKANGQITNGRRLMVQGRPEALSKQVGDKLYTDLNIDVRTYEFENKKSTQAAADPHVEAEHQGNLRF